MVTTGEYELRALNVDRAVKGFALENYKLKQVCLIQKSNSWSESYFKETKTELTGGTGSGVAGVARLANFPYGEPTWTQTTSYHKKHAMEGVISYEDAMTDYIDVQARTLLRIGRAVAYSVDRAIYSAITSDASVNTAAASSPWDAAVIANRDPIFDILTGKEYLNIDNYDPEGAYLLLSPTDYKNLISNAKVMQNPTFKAADIVYNGRVGQICGLNIIVSNAVDADEAAIVKAPEALTWKSVVGLTTNTEYDAGIKYTIRAWEIGVCMVTNPEAIHIITNTQA